jgi:hypothetical protein
MLSFIKSFSIIYTLFKSEENTKKYPQDNQDIILSLLEEGNIWKYIYPKFIEEKSKNIVTLKNKYYARETV